MGHPRFATAEIERRGQEWYDRDIRTELEGRYDGKIVVIDIETGDYEVDDSGLAASHRALARHPGAALYGLRVGYDVAEGFGGFAPCADAYKFSRHPVVIQHETKRCL